LILISRRRSSGMGWDGMGWDGMGCKQDSAQRSCPNVNLKHRQHRMTASDNIIKSNHAISRPSITRPTPSAVTNDTWNVCSNQPAAPFAGRDTDRTIRDQVPGSIPVHRVCNLAAGANLPFTVSCSSPPHVSLTVARCPLGKGPPLDETLEGHREHRGRGAVNGALLQVGGVCGSP
jgi:hypothetical protein